MRKAVTILLIFICLSVQSCNRSLSGANAFDIVGDTIPYQALGKTELNKVIIGHDINLKGSLCILPSGITLVANGGVIKNGTLKGNMTRLECKGNVFDKVTIIGSWNVPQISTSMFADLSYENALKDVFALSNPKLKNTISVEGGCYTVKALKNSDACLTLCENTELVLMGIIQIVPNGYSRYDIIRASGENIIIHGNGSIMGDRFAHTGTEGEWGMGIRFHGATNSSVRGITIKDCWGDCIYVGGNSKNVLIENCILDHGRRQGISVTKADNVTIRNCNISNVSGTNPQYAIDLEPNANDTVDHILIENVEAVDCEGGFLATVGKKNVQGKRIGEVTIRNCKLNIKNRHPIRMKNSEDVSIEDCTINTTNEKAAIYTADIQNLMIKNNSINVEKSLTFTIKNAVKKVSKSNVQQTIEAIRVRHQDIRNNTIIEH